MNVLSLFDGISCGRVALERAGIKVDAYYASEIDKYAIKITQKNYPDTIQLGDVNNIDFTQFIGKIDLLLGGSPCQDLSIAKQNRQGLKGERSKLFWKYVEALNIVKPKWFIFENVASMKKEDKDIITKELGVEPIMIDSALVSAQQRKRLYWTNVPGIQQPEDKHIYLQDILEKYVDSEYYLKNNYLEWFNKNKDYNLKKKFCSLNAKKAITLTARQYASWRGNYIEDSFGIRKLTPIECERLQTLPDNYTEGISNTQRYKCLGNGWTVDVIVHILKYIKY